MVQYRYRYYSKADGSEPVSDFIDSLPKKDQGKYAWTMEQHIAVTGPLTPHGILHKVGEFYQITFGSYRILCDMKGDVYTLLHAFRKTSQTTKQTDIDKADGYLKDMKDRGTY